MPQLIATVGDTVTGVCSATGHVGNLPFTGIWQSGSPTCTHQTRGIIRQGDIGVADCGHRFKPLSWSSVSKADGLPIHRLGDLVEIIEGPGGGSTVSCGGNAKSN